MHTMPCVLLLPERQPELAVCFTQLQLVSPAGPTSVSAGGSGELFQRPVPTGGPGESLQPSVPTGGFWRTTPVVCSRWEFWRPAPAVCSCWGFWTSTPVVFCSCLSVQGARPAVCLHWRIQAATPAIFCSCQGLYSIISATISVTRSITHSSHVTGHSATRGCSAIVCSCLFWSSQV